MYAIRVDATRHILTIDLSGRVTTPEALRAVTHAFALAEASALTAVVCDIRKVRRGPGGLLPVAATIALRLSPGMRVALLGLPEQEPFVERIIRYTGSATGLRFLESETEAASYLEPVPRKKSVSMGSTELRHAEELLGSPKQKGLAEPGPVRVARRNVSGAPAA